MLASRLFGAAVLLCSLPGLHCAIAADTVALADSISAPLYNDNIPPHVKERGTKAVAAIMIDITLLSPEEVEAILNALRVSYLFYMTQYSAFGDDGRDGWSCSEAECANAYSVLAAHGDPKVLVVCLALWFAVRTNNRSWDQFDLPAEAVCIEICRRANAANALHLADLFEAELYNDSPCYGQEPATTRSQLAARCLLLILAPQAFWPRKDPWLPLVRLRECMETLKQRSWTDITMFRLGAAILPYVFVSDEAARQALSHLGPDDSRAPASIIEDAAHVSERSIKEIDPMSGADRLRIENVIGHLGLLWTNMDTADEAREALSECNGTTAVAIDMWRTAQIQNLLSQRRSRFHGAVPAVGICRWFIESTNKTNYRDRLAFLKWACYDPDAKTAGLAIYTLGQMIEQNEGKDSKRDFLTKEECDDIVALISQFVPKGEYPEQPTPRQWHAMGALYRIEQLTQRTGLLPEAIKVQFVKRALETYQGALNLDEGRRTLEEHPEDLVPVLW
ncbi:MAG TPA: hypothetical protein VMW24_22885 [Sedimentisphaerales bacterium]|nr:hypothetical protein [Sedimentisphaerales bacterium]